jgi:hypothetical protein
MIDMFDNLLKDDGAAAIVLKQWLKPRARARAARVGAGQPSPEGAGEQKEFPRGGAV